MGAREFPYRTFDRRARLFGYSPDKDHAQRMASRQGGWVEQLVFGTWMPL